MAGTRKGRRGHGEGSVFQRQDGRWVAQLDLGRDDNGKRTRRSYYGRTQQEAIAKRDEAKALVNTGRQLPKLQQTVESWLEYWTGEVLPGTVRDTTADSYGWMIGKYINPQLGRIKVGKLSATDVQTWLRKMESAGLSASTRRRARAILRRAMADAVRMGKAAHNPVDAVKAPKLDEARTDDSLDIEAAKNLLKAAQGDRLEALVTVALTVGLRRGEALGLRWDDVDLDSGAMTVRRTLKRRVGHGLVVDEPKTSSGRRTIPLPKVCVTALREHRIRQATERLKAGPQWVDEGYVFTTSKGTPIDPRNLTDLYHDITAKAGLGKARFHALRHTAASLMLAQGVPLEVVSRTLGHSGLAITSDVYGHLGQKVLRRGADAMDGAFGG